ncbi:MAG TPA: phosphoribosyltransferase family protein [Ignavibacteria bacterium]|nr:phosphoribosyltransferase family protein [Ignavibacteria bacterium]HMR40553.1 phosphoribosyltransferase family protein [Ignavibacteria bacterium]
MFRDRDHAAGILAGRLEKYNGSDNAVIAIPRGGAAIGFELARLLGLPLELILTHTIGHPYNREYPIGMVSLFGAVFNEDFGVDENYLRSESESAKKALMEKYFFYMPGRAPLDFKGRTVILTDDGLASGTTMLPVIEMLIRDKASEIIVAVPVASECAVKKIRSYVNVMIYCLTIPDNFYAVNQVYENFENVSDEEAVRLLRLANEMFAGSK